MQLYYGQKGVSAVTGIGMGFDQVTGSGFNGPFVVGDIGYFFVVTNTTTALPTPAGWSVVGSGTLASGGKWAIWRRAMQPADTYATTFSTVQVVSGASGIWGGALAFVRATKSGTLNIESETINNNGVSTAVAVPAGSSANPYALIIAFAFIDFEQNQDTIIPSRNEYVLRTDSRGVSAANTLPTPYFLCGGLQSKDADSWAATASVASVVATIVISETGTSGHDARSTVESKSAHTILASPGNANKNALSTVESKPIKGTLSDIEQVFTRQGYGGGVQIW